MLRNNIPDVFISYARADGEDFARNLRDQLEAQHITTWLDRFGMTGGQDWWQQITQALEQVQYLVLVATPAAMKSSVVKDEWEYARKHGVCIFPVLVPETPIDFSALPRWMSKSHFYDLQKQGDKFINDLKTRCPKIRVPFMAPELPKNYIERTRVHQQLVNSFLDGDNPASRTLVITGSGGFGKSTQSVALCHDKKIRTAFDDGILWVSLGSNPDILSILTQLYAALADERPNFFNEEDASLKIAEKMEKKDLLLVIDDVWQLAHLRPFLRGGANCARLITSRDAQIALDIDAQVFEMSGMGKDEALQLFTTRLQIDDSDQALFNDLIVRLGDCPLLLDLASAALKRHLLHDKNLKKAIERVQVALERKGITAFDNPELSIAKTIEVSLDLLDEQKRQLYKELVIFPVDLEIPISVIQALWAIDAYDAQDLIDRLSELSLINSQTTSGKTAIRIHNLIHSYLKSQITETALLHRKLLAQFADPYTLDDNYLWRWYFYHLEQAGQNESIHALLNDFRWLQAKLQATDVAALIRDYQYAQDSATYRLIRDAIMLSAHVISRDVSQFASQLLGRLNHLEGEQIVNLITSAKTWIKSVWLRPHTRSLTAPGSGLIRTITEHQDSIVGMALLPQGSKGISASADKTIRMWQVESGIVEKVIGHHNSPLTGVAFHPQKNAVFSITTSGEIFEWDSTTGASSRIWKTGDVPLHAIAISSDGHYVAVASGVRLGTAEQNIVHLLNLTSGELTKLRGHTNRVTALAWIPNTHTFLSVGEDRRVLRWDATTQRGVRLFQYNQSLSCVAVQAGGQYVAIGTKNGKLIIADLTKETSAIYDAHQQEITALIFRHDMLVTASKDATYITWDVSQFKPNEPIYAHARGILALAYDERSGRLFTGAEDGHIKIWSLMSATHQLERTPHDGPVTRVKLLADKSLFLSSSYDHSIKQYAYDEGLIPVKALSQHQGAVFDVDIFEHNRYFASLALERIQEVFSSQIHVWDAESGIDIQTIVGPSKPVTRLKMIPNTHFAVTADCHALIDSDYFTIFSPRLRLWDLDSGSEIYSFEGHQKGITDFDFHPNERDIVSVSHDGTIKVWDWQKRQLLKQLATFEQGINSIRCLSNGSQVIVGLLDGTLLLIDYASGETIKSFMGHSKQILGIDKSLDDQYLVSCSEDNTLRLWDVEHEVTIATFTADSPILTCAISMDNAFIIAGDQSGHLHVLTIEQTESPVPRLLEIFSQGNTFAREAAIRALAAIGTTETAKSLLRALTDANPAIRRAAIWGLAQTEANHQPEVIDAMIASLKDQDPSVLKTTAHVLGEMRIEEAVDSLVVLLQNPDVSVAREVALALGKISGEKSQYHLLTLLQHPDASDDILLATISALTAIGNPQAVAHILKLVHSPSHFVREASVRALGQLGDTQIHAQLVPLLDDKIRYVRISAYEALLHLQWIPPQTRQLMYYIDTRQWSLCVTTGIVAVPYLLNILEDDSLYPHERVAVVNALGKIGDKSAVPVLMGHIRNNDESFRHAIIRAFGMIQDTRPLLDLWDIFYQTSNPETRKIAQEAIQRIHAYFVPSGELDIKSNDALVALLDADTWDAKRAIIAEHVEVLLSVGVEITLKALLAKEKSQNNQTGSNFYYIHIALLQSINSDGLDEVFEKIATDQIPVPRYNLPIQKQRVQSPTSDIPFESLSIPAEVITAANNFMLSQSWDEARHILEANLEWLTQPQAETYLMLGADFYTQQGDTHTATMFQMHLEILRRAKVEGIDFTFRVIQQDDVDPEIVKVVNLYLNKASLDDAVEYLERYQEMLFRIDADVYLEREIHRANVTGNRLRATSMHLALLLLREAREKDIATAYRERQTIHQTIDKYLDNVLQFGLDDRFKKFIEDNSQWLFRLEATILLTYRAARARGLGDEESAEIIEALQRILINLRSGHLDEDTMPMTLYVSFDEIKQAIHQFVSAKDLKYARDIARAQRNILFQPEADILFDRMIEQAATSGNQRQAESLRMYQKLLMQCRQIGIDAAFHQSLSKIDNENFSRLFGLAQKYFANDDFAIAWEYIEHALSLQPNQHDVMQLAVEVAIKQNRLPVALDYLSKLIDADSVSSEIYYKRATIYAQMGQFHQAIDDMTHAINLQPSRVDFYSLRGRYYQALHRHQQALADFEYLATLGIETQPDILLAKCRSLLWVSRASDALALAKHLQQTTHANEAIYLLADAYRAQGEYALALKQIQQDDSLSAVRLRGRIAFEQGEIEAMLALLSQAIDANPDDDALYHQRGCAYLYDKDYASARKDFTKAINLNRDVADYYYWRALTYLLLDNLTLAQKDIQLTDAKVCITPEVATQRLFWLRLINHLKDNSPFDTSGLADAAITDDDRARLAYRIGSIQAKPNQTLETALATCSAEALQYERLYLTILQKFYPHLSQIDEAPQPVDVPLPQAVSVPVPQPSIAPEVPAQMPQASSPAMPKMPSKIRLFFVFEELLQNHQDMTAIQNLFKVHSDLIVSDEMRLLILYNEYQCQKQELPTTQHQLLLGLIDQAQQGGIEKAFEAYSVTALFKLLPFAEDFIERTISALRGSAMDKMRHAQYAQQQAMLAKLPEDITFVQAVQMALFGEDLSQAITTLNEKYRQIWGYIMNQVK